MTAKGKKFKWVRIGRMYGIRNWVGYELFIEGRPARAALVEKIGATDYYTALVDFNDRGGSGTYLGFDKKTGKITTYHYLQDIKKAVEKYYGLKS